MAVEAGSQSERFSRPKGSVVWPDGNGKWRNLVSESSRQRVNPWCVRRRKDLGATVGIGHGCRMNVRSARWLLPVIYLGFISLGLPDGSLGTAWPQLHESMGLAVGLAGPLLLSATLFGAVSSLMSGWVIRRFNTGPVVLVSCALTATGLAMLAQAPHVGWLWAAALPLGLGAGAVDASLNGFVAQHYEARHMSWLHACWGIGATAGPLVMAATLTTSMEGWRTGYLILAGSQFALVAMFAVTLGLWRQAPDQRKGSVANDARGEPLPAEPAMSANSPAGGISAGLFALYVGLEVMAGLWVATFLVGQRGASPAVAGLCATAYYGSITVGRFLSGLVVDRWGNRRVVRGALWLGLLGALVFALPLPIGGAAIALMMIGGGLSVIYPGLMHEVPRRFRPEDVQTVIGRQNSAAYLGAAVLPVVAGGLIQTVGVTVLPGALIMGVIVLQLGVARLDRLT